MRATASLGMGLAASIVLLLLAAESSADSKSYRLQSMEPISEALKKSAFVKVFSDVKPVDFSWGGVDIDARTFRLVDEDSGHAVYEVPQAVFRDVAKRHAIHGDLLLHVRHRGLTWCVSGYVLLKDGRLAFPQPAEDIKALVDCAPTGKITEKIDGSDVTISLGKYPYVWMHKTGLAVSGARIDVRGPHPMTFKWAYLAYDGSALKVADVPLSFFPRAARAFAENDALRAALTIIGFRGDVREACLRDGPHVSFETGKYIPRSFSFSYWDGQDGPAWELYLETQREPRDLAALPRMRDICSHPKVAKLLAERYIPRTSRFEYRYCSTEDPSVTFTMNFDWRDPEFYVVTVSPEAGGSVNLTVMENPRRVSGPVDFALIGAWVAVAFSPVVIVACLVIFFWPNRRRRPGAA
jgi:hypothetical protein